MSTVIESLESAQLRRTPAFDAGDRVKVHFQVVEGTRRRTQVFEGVVIKRQGHGARETFTVRKQSFGVGVERTFPLHSPKIERIEVAARGDVRRAKLYYLRGRVGKRARVRERRGAFGEEAVERELLHAPAPAATEPPQEAAAAEAPEDEAAAESPQEEVVAEAPEEAAAAEASEEGVASDAPPDDAGADEVPTGAGGPEDESSSADEAAEPPAEAEAAAEEPSEPEAVTPEAEGEKAESEERPAEEPDASSTAPEA